MNVRIECYIGDQRQLLCRIAKADSGKRVLDARLSYALRMIKQMRLTVINYDELVAWLNENVMFVPTDKTAVRSIG